MTQPQQPTPASEPASSPRESQSDSLGSKYQVQYAASFEDALKAAGLAFDSLAPEVEETPDDAAPAPEPAAVPSEASPAEAKTETKPHDAPPDEPAPPQLKAIMEREAALLERETAWKEAQTDLLTLKQRLDAYDAAQQQFKLNPIDYIRSLAPDADFDDLARQLWYEKLGPAAPPEYRTTKDVRGAHVEVQKLRAELEAEKRRTSEENARKEAETAEARRVEELRAFTSAVPSTFPSVQSLAKQKPDVAVRMMHDAARMIAPGLGRNPTAAEAAQAVQKYLDEIGYAAPAQVPATPAQPPASAPQSPPTTIRNAHSSVQPSRVPPNEDDPAVLRKRAFEAMAAAMGNPALADLG